MKNQANETAPIKTINPATEEMIEEYTVQSQAEVKQIIDDAHEAFKKWRSEPQDTRSEIIKKLATAIRNHKDELAELMTVEMGKPISQAYKEVDRCASLCEYSAEEAIRELKTEERPLEGGQKGMIVYQPLGVVLSIQPWNFPLYQAVRSTIPNILVGNTVLLKHAKNVSGMSKKLGELYAEVGLPDNVFTPLFLEDEGTEVILKSDKVVGVALTGSSRAGKAVGELAGANIKKTLLELGGSDPYIVLDDADLDKAVETCVTGRIANSGQTCVNAKRFIVMEGVYEEFKKKYVEAMSKVEYGDPMNEDTQMGPLARKDLRETLHDQVQESIGAGATCLLGGEMPEGKGYFYPATVLENIKPGMPAYDDELFGPVASLFKVSSEDEAIEIANDHRYGLGGGVLSSNTERAIEVAKRIETGMVSVNGFFGSQANMPFGGIKQSGHGREHGGFGIKEFVNIKSIYVGDND